MNADPESLNTTEIHGIHQRAAHLLRASSEALGWRNLLMLDFHEPPFSATFPPAADHLLLYLRRGTVRLSSRIAGTRSTTTFYPGQLNLVPANADVVVSTEDDFDCLHLYVKSDMVDAVFQEFDRPSDDRLIPRFALRDALLGSLVQACAAEMDAPSMCSAAYTDHLAWALAAQLVQTCSSGAPSLQPQPLNTPLGAGKLRIVDDYVRSHLAYDIGVSDLAKAVGYSAVQFTRLFKRATGIAPYRFIQERRIETVRFALTSAATLAEIAAATGFCNQEHMTRVFRAFHGITPGRYRRMQAVRTAD